MAHSSSSHKLKITNRGLIRDRFKKPFSAAPCQSQLRGQSPERRRRFLSGSILETKENKERLKRTEANRRIQKEEARRQEDQYRDGSAEMERVAQGNRRPSTREVQVRLRGNLAERAA